MSFWTSLIGGGVKEAGEGVKSALSGIGVLARDIRSAITGDIDPKKKAEIQIKLAELEGIASQGQMRINEIEAGSKSVFVAGWRPFIGWICGFALGYHYIVMPFLVWLLSTFNIQTSAPVLDMGALMGLLMGMLGLAGMRTYEKKNNVEGNR